MELTRKEAEMVAEFYNVADNDSQVGGLDDSLLMKEISERYPSINCTEWKPHLKKYRTNFINLVKFHKEHCNEDCGISLYMIRQVFERVFGGCSPEEKEFFR